MSVRFLLVESDAQLAELRMSGCIPPGMEMELAESMTVAIRRLLTNEYFFIGINSDNIDYMPLLSTMRSTTNSPILIVTSHFTVQAEVAALENGADVLSPWYATPEDDMASILANISRISNRVNTQRSLSKIIVYQDLLIAPLPRCVFVENVSIDLTRHEFDLLYYLAVNYGKVLSYKQIYRRVWGGEYEDAARNLLWSSINRLRNKLKTCPDSVEYIDTVRDYGYRFPLGSGEIM